MSSRSRLLLLLLIIAFGLYLRLNRSAELFHFEMDEEVVAWKTLRFWHDGQPFLIGGGTPFGVHLGPAFYYLSAIPLIFTKGDPVGWIFLTSLVSLSTLYLMWLVGKTLYSETVGLIAAALWAFSFTPTMFDRHWWPLVLDPLLSLLTLLSLFHIMKGKSRWWIVLGLTLSFAWQADLTNLVLFLSVTVVALKTFKKQWKHIPAALGILTISFIPLVIFELRHPGTNLGRLSITRSDPAMAESDLSKPILDLARFIPSTFASLLIPSWRSNNLADWYTWCKDVARVRTSSPPIMMMIATGILLYPVVRWFRKKKISDLSLVVVIGSGIGGISMFRFFGGDLFDFYLAPLYPIFLIILASVIGSNLVKYQILYRSMMLTILLGIFSFNIFSTTVSARHGQGLHDKQRAVGWVVQQIGDRPFALESISRCHRYNGIRYLFMLHGIEPVMSFMDPNYAWLYDESPTTSHPAIFVAFVTPQDLTPADETRYNELKRRAIDSKQFGDFDVLIADNQDHALSIDF